MPRTKENPTRADYEALDWSLPRRELARLMGVSVSTICEWRIRLGIPRSVTGPKPKVDWAKVDWNSAAQLESLRRTFTPEWIRQMRKRYAK